MRIEVESWFIRFLTVTITFLMSCTLIKIIIKANNEPVPAKNRIRLIMMTLFFLLINTYDFITAQDAL